MSAYNYEKTCSSRRFKGDLTSILGCSGCEAEFPRRKRQARRRQDPLNTTTSSTACSSLDETSLSRRSLEAQSTSTMAQLRSLTQQLKQMISDTEQLLRQSTYPPKHRRETTTATPRRQQAATSQDGGTKPAPRRKEKAAATALQRVTNAQQQQQQLPPPSRIPRPSTASPQLLVDWPRQQHAPSHQQSPLHHAHRRFHRWRRHSAALPGKDGLSPAQPPQTAAPVLQIREGAHLVSNRDGVEVCSLEQLVGGISAQGGRRHSIGGKKSLLPFIRPRHRRVSCGAEYEQMPGSPPANTPEGYASSSIPIDLNSPAESLTFGGAPVAAVAVDRKHSDDMTPPAVQAGASPALLRDMLDVFLSREDSPLFADYSPSNVTEHAEATPAPSAAKTRVDDEAPLIKAAAIISQEESPALRPLTPPNDEPAPSLMPSTRSHRIVRGGTTHPQDEPRVSDEKVSGEAPGVREQQHRQSEPETARTAPDEEEVRVPLGRNSEPPALTAIAAAAAGAADEDPLQRRIRQLSTTYT